MDPVVMFPHFVRNRKDPLFIFTDAPFHRDCFFAHPLRESVEKRITERKRRLKDPRCVVCGVEIPADLYTTGYLTEDTTSSLYEFNYVHMHHAHILLWPRLDEFQQLIAELISSGNYEGPPILPDLP
jgi:hypothetical protein